jgi:hypothetical protein
MPRWRKKGQKKPPPVPEADRLNPEEAEMRKKKESPWPSRERRQESRVNEEDKVVIELMTNILLPAHTLLKMEIVLSQRRKRIHTVGIVRWARSVYEEELFEMGIEFTQISAEDQMLLLEHTYRKRD